MGKKKDKPISDSFVKKLFIGGGIFAGLFASYQVGKRIEKNKSIKEKNALIESSKKIQ